MDIDIQVSDGCLHVPATQVEPATREQQTQVMQAEPEIELGPGWFESSRTLRLGLWVREHSEAETDVDFDHRCAAGESPNEHSR